MVGTLALAFAGRAGGRKALGVALMAGLVWLGVVVDALQLHARVTAARDEQNRWVGALVSSLITPGTGHHDLFISRDAIDGTEATGEKAVHAVSREAGLAATNPAVGDEAWTLGAQRGIPERCLMGADSPDVDRLAADQRGQDGTPQAPCEAEHPVDFRRRVHALDIRPPQRRRQVRLG